MTCQRQANVLLGPPGGLSGVEGLWASALCTRALVPLQTVAVAAGSPAACWKERRAGRDARRHAWSDAGACATATTQTRRLSSFAASRTKQAVSSYGTLLFAIIVNLVNI